MNKRIELLKSNYDLEEIWKEKSKFCCMVVSNPNAKKRIDFFKKLSAVKQVDSGGAVLNNVGGRVKDKLEFINNYKFVIAFENESHDGYTTEKILEPILKNCIPIYWGNKLIGKDFNPERFINVHDFESFDGLFERLLEIENNPKLALDIISKPVLSSSRQSYLKERKEVFALIEKVINSKKVPKAKTYIGYFYFMKVNLMIITRKVIKIVKKALF